MAADPVNPPPSPKVLDYPGLMAVGLGAVFTIILLIASARFDATGGPLTISLLIVLAVIGVMAVSVFYTIPNDEPTGSVIGALVLALGAVIAYWLGRRKDGS